MTRDVFRALGRRWYIVVTGLLVTVGLALGAYHISPPTYTANGLILLLPSKTVVGPGGNPFLALSDLDQPAGILVAYFSGAPAAADVKTKAPTAQYQVLINTSARGPIIEVDVTDKTSAGALSALDYISEQIPVVLNRLQTQVSAPTDAIITSMPLTVDTKAKADYSGTIRMVITAALVGLLLTGLVAFALDGLLNSRRARKQVRAESGETAAAASTSPSSPPAPEPQHPRKRRRRSPRPGEAAPADLHPDDAAPEAVSEDDDTATEQMVTELSGSIPAETGQRT